MKVPAIKIIPVVLSLLLPVSGPVQAVETGDREIQIGGGFFMAQGDAATGTAQLELAYGYWWTPQWQIGIRQLASYELNDPLEDIWTGSTTVFANFYPWSAGRGQRFQPYIGTFLGPSYSDVDVTGTVGPTAGVRVDISDSAFFTAQYRYELLFRELDTGGETDDFNDGNHIMTMGVGFHWD
jgi:hypothetical protein